jgi:hypothetical protein
MLIEADAINDAGQIVVGGRLCRKLPRRAASGCKSSHRKDNQARGPGLPQLNLAGDARFISAWPTALSFAS